MLVKYKTVKKIIVGQYGPSFLYYIIGLSRCCSNTYQFKFLVVSETKIERGRIILNCLKLFRSNGIKRDLQLNEITRSIFWHSYDKMQARFFQILSSTVLKIIV